MFKLSTKRALIALTLVVCVGGGFGLRADVLNKTWIKNKVPCYENCGAYNENSVAFSICGDKCFSVCWDKCATANGNEDLALVACVEECRDEN